MCTIFDKGVSKVCRGKHSAYWVGFSAAEYTKRTVSVLVPCSNTQDNTLRAARVGLEPTTLYSLGRVLYIPTELLYVPGYVILTIASTNPT